MSSLPQLVAARGRIWLPGLRLTADLLEESRVPKGAVPEGAFTSVEEVVGLVLTADRVRGDAITTYVAGDSTAAAGIPAKLSPEHVAIAVDVDQATGLAGIVRTGQRVAVIAILDPQAIQREAGGSVIPAYLPTETAVAAEVILLRVNYQHQLLLLRPPPSLRYRRWPASR